MIVLQMIQRSSLTVDAKVFYKQLNFSSAWTDFVELDNDEYFLL